MFLKHLVGQRVVVDYSVVYSWNVQGLEKEIETPEVGSDRPTPT